MIINRNSWHYKVYEFTYFMSNFDPKAQTNLCQYVRRILLMTIPMGLLTIVMCLLIMVACILFYVLGPIFGWLPTEWKKPWKIFDYKGTYKYQGLRLWKPEYSSFQLYPFHALVICIVAFLHWAAYHHYGSRPLINEAWVIGIIFSILAFLVGCALFDDSKTGELIKTYVSAKKQKVCPVVKFED